MKENIRLNKHESILIYEEKDNCLNIYQQINNKAIKILKTLKSNQRSHVDLFQYEGRLFVFKRPFEKNRRKWVRATTLYRKCEAECALDNMRILHKMGLITNNPVMAYIKKQNGMVIDSFFIYEYLDASPVTVNEYPLVIKQLHQIHSGSFIHNDPHLENFLVNQGKIILIDANIKAVFLFKKLRYAYEFVYLLMMNPEIKPFMKKETESIFFNLSMIYYHYLNLWRALKRFIRRTNYKYKQ